MLRSSTISLLRCKFICINVCLPASRMEEEDLGTWLGLATGCAATRSSHGDHRRQPAKEERRFDRDERAVSKKGGEGGKQRMKIGEDDGRSWQGPCPSDGGSDGSGGGGGARKKLRLSKEQSAMLEDSFRAHNILSHGQKQELARQLNLSSRQVEVWFQNRRARTKLKQTEVDCEFLKRCCESLTDENRRLQHELAELHRSAAAAAAAAGSQLYGQLPRAATMVNVCPSCQKVTVNN